MTPIAVALVGATGQVAEALVEILDEREFPLAELFLLDEADGVGHALAYKGRNQRVRDVASFDFAQVSLVFFAGSAALTLRWQPKTQAAGCTVVDLSGALSVDEAPRLVADVNSELLRQLTPPYALACPAPTTLALATALAPLRFLGLQRITLTACLSVSSLGRAGVNELARQTAELLNARPLEPRLFDRQIAFNLLAQTESPGTDGHTPAEVRIVEELRQVLMLPKLQVSVTCIQAPVFFGDSISVSLLASREINLPEVIHVLDTAAGVELVDAGDYPTVVGDALGQDVVHLGRLRKGLNDPASLDLWIASDNVRKGAALNAVQLAELLIKSHL